jgi:hypothetical protein
MMKEVILLPPFEWKRTESTHMVLRFFRWGHSGTDSLIWFSNKELQGIDE